MAGSAWDGADEALAKMRNLAPGLVKKGIRAAARKGARVFMDAARVGAKRFDDPSSVADIAKNITIRESGKEGKKLQAIVMRVGVKGGARPNNKDPKNTGHWRFKEFGTSEMKAEPFMRPAMSSNIDKATAAVVRELIPQIDKQIKKAAK